MRIYECTLYERPKFGDAQPVKVDGHLVTREIVALNAGKARFTYFRRLSECWGAVRLQDIRVRSLSKRKADQMQPGWQDRLERANSIIRVMASYGRRFFSENSDNPNHVENPFVAHFKVDPMGELWFVDRYTRRPVLVRHQEWRFFSDGGTLRSIVEHLAKHICEATPINIRYFSAAPKHFCDGDIWGYGQDMEKVHDGVSSIVQAAAKGVL